jgi:hypothetical protein
MNRSRCMLFVLLLLSVGANANIPGPVTEGLVLWLDGNDPAAMTLEGQNQVVRWLDKSGKGNDVTVDNRAAATLPTRVDNALNGHGVVRFSGTAAFMGQAIRTSKGPVTVFVVSRRLPEQAGGKAWQRLFSSRPQLADNDNVAPNFGISVQQTSAYEPALALLETSDVPIGPFAVARNVVGTSEILRGDIAEVLVYDRPFSNQDERRTVFEYLAQKWAVVVPQQADAWTRVGPLGPTPTHVTPDLPLSDQANAGGWKLDTRLSDEFNGSTLDAERWHVNRRCFYRRTPRSAAVI